MRVAFIGLGVMGYPMAGHVQKSGTSVCVYNRTRKKAEEWCQEFGGEMADTPAEAAKNCDVVLVCVGNDCLLYTSPSPRDRTRSRMPSSA
mgnify:CR=1 FL=1